MGKDIQGNPMKYMHDGSPVEYDWECNHTFDAKMKMTKPGLIRDANLILREKQQ